MSCAEASARARALVAIDIADAGPDLQRQVNALSNTIRNLCHQQAGLLRSVQQSINEKKQRPCDCYERERMNLQQGRNRITAATPAAPNALGEA